MIELKTGSTYNYTVGGLSFVGVYLGDWPEAFEYETSTTWRHHDLKLCSNIKLNKGK